MAINVPGQPFWAKQINQDTGLPFQSEAEFNAKAKTISTKYSGLIDKLTSYLQRWHPEMNRKEVRAKMAQYLAAHQSVPGNADELSSWAKGFMDSMRRYGIDDFEAERFKAGWNDEAIAKDQKGYELWRAQRNQAIWGATNQEWQLDKPESLSLADEVQSAEDEDPGFITGADEEDDFNARLDAFKRALYNPETAQRLSTMAANQAGRGAHAAGVRGGAMGQGLSQAAADALFSYEGNVNNQAMNLMQIENAREMNAEQLALQRAQFDAAQRMAALQQRQQLAGSVGGVIGGVVGSLPALFPGGQGIAAITAPALAGLGTGIGTASVGGYSTRSSSSLGGSSTRKSGKGSLGNI